MLIQESQPAGSQQIFNIVGILLAKVHTVALWPMPCFQLGPEFLGAGKRSVRRRNNLITEAEDARSALRSSPDVKASSK